MINCKIFKLANEAIGYSREVETITKDNANVLSELVVSFQDLQKLKIKLAIKRLHRQTIVNDLPLSKSSQYLHSHRKSQLDDHKRLNIDIECVSFKTSIYETRFGQYLI